MTRRARCGRSIIGRLVFIVVVLVLSASESQDGRLEFISADSASKYGADIMLNEAGVAIALGVLPPEYDKIREAVIRSYSIGATATSSDSPDDVEVRVGILRAIVPVWEDDARA